MSSPRSKEWELVFAASEHYQLRAYVDKGMLHIRFNNFDGQGSCGRGVSVEQLLARDPEAGFQADGSWVVFKAPLGVLDADQAERVLAYVTSAVGLLATAASGPRLRPSLLAEQA